MRRGFFKSRSDLNKIPWHNLISPSAENRRVSFGRCAVATPSSRQAAGCCL